MTHRIALIHAVRVAIPPVEEAFARHWPSAVLWLRGAVNGAAR